MHQHLDTQDLEETLKQADKYRLKCITTEEILLIEADILNLNEYAM